VVPELSIRDFRANLKDYLDRVEEGEVFTLRDGAIHIAHNESCGDNIAEETAHRLDVEA